VEADEPRGSPPRRAGPWLALALVLVAAPFAYFGGHVVDEEAVGFLFKYWDADRPALVKIFDVRGWDFYQGRELSYAIDYLDARWVGLVLRAGLVFFGAPSALLAALGLVLVTARLGPRALPRLEPAHRWLCLLLLMSSFVFATTMGTLYRATKPLVAPLVLGLFLLALAEHHRPRLGPRGAFAAGFLYALALSALDRQGLFFVLAAIGVMGVVGLRTRRGGPLAAGMGAAVATWYGYFRVLGPLVIQRLEGYWPSDRFQRLRPERLADPSPWLQALDILGDWTSVVLGGLPIGVVLALLAPFALWWAWSQRHRPRNVLAAAFLAAAGLVGQLTMVAIMVDRHPPVAWVSHRLWYYPLPYQAVLVFGLMWLLDRTAARRADGKLPLAVIAALAGLVALNLLRWPEKRLEIATDPPFADQLRRSALLVRSLQQGQAEPLLDGEHRRLYFEILSLSPRLGDRARSQVSEGEGVLTSEIDDGRVVAWAERQSQIVPTAPGAGRYVIAGRLRLREGDAVQILAGQPRRLIGRVERPGPGEGDVPFRVVLDLAKGRNDVRLVSRLPDVRVPDWPKRAWAGFRVLLPVAMWRDDRAVPSTDVAAASP
jgi:hypothetical protein